MENEHENYFINVLFKKQDLTNKFINLLMSPGCNTGKKLKVYNYFKLAMDEITNPSSEVVFIKAIYNSLIPLTIRYIKYGSITRMKSVYTTSDRQISLALNYLVKGIRNDKNKISIKDKIKNEIYNAYNNNPKSYAIKKKIEILNLAEQANN